MGQPNRRQISTVAQETETIAPGRQFNAQPVFRSDAFRQGAQGGQLCFQSVASVTLPMQLLLEIEPLQYRPRLIINLL
jgi:hypothetical protein